MAKSLASCRRIGAEFSLRRFGGHEYGGTELKKGDVARVGKLHFVVQRICVKTREIKSSCNSWTLFELYFFGHVLEKNMGNRTSHVLPIYFDN